MEKRELRREQRYLWITRIVPWEVADEHIASKDYIAKALQKITDNTCIQFVPKTDEHKNWIRFYKGSGCWSSLGRKYWRAGYQLISLGGGCMSTGIIQHE